MKSYSKNFLSYIYSLSFLLPLGAHAQTTPPPTGGGGFGPPPGIVNAPDNLPEGELTNIERIFQFVSDIVGWIFTFAIIFGVAALIIAGIMYITAAGSDRAKTASNIMIFAIIGIAIAALAWAIVNLVGNVFVGEDLVI